MSTPSVIDKGKDAAIMQTLKNSLYPTASDSSIEMVLSYCRAAGLDVMQKPVHIVPMWDAKSRGMRDVVMPGIGLYRTAAARTGQYAGVTAPEFGPTITETIGNKTISFPEWCRVTVKRRLPTGEVVDFTAVEFWRENYAKKGGAEKSIAPNDMWERRPFGQLAKCAESQALRKAFPELGAQPTAEEMEGQTIQYGNTFDASTGEIVATDSQSLPLYNDADIDKKLQEWAAGVDSGRFTADGIISRISSKYTLSPAQIARIMSIEAPARDDVNYNDTQEV